MKKKLAKFLILPPLIFLSFQNFFFNISGENYVSHVDRITQEFVKEMEEKYNFHCIATGGSMPYDVEKISVKFFLYHEANLEEAKNIMINATERFLEMINSDEQIRPYLRDYPFEPKRIEISVSFNPSDIHSYDETIKFVHQGKNIIFYYKLDTINDKLVKIAEEPYEEAKQLVETYTNTNKENAN